MNSRAIVLPLVVATALWACKPDPTLPMPPTNTIPEPELTDGVYLFSYSFLFKDSLGSAYKLSQNEQVQSYNAVCVKRFADYYLFGKYLTNMADSTAWCEYCDSCRLYYHWNDSAQSYFIRMGSFTVNDLLDPIFSNSLNASITTPTGGLGGWCACEYYTQPNNSYGKMEFITDFGDRRLWIYMDRVIPNNPM